MPLIATGETYHGKECKHCGTTEKYRSNRACKHCTAEKRKILAAKRKEAAAKLPPREKGLEPCLGCGETKNYHFLDYCRKCQEKQRIGWMKEQKQGFICAGCGETKFYPFKDYCRKCQAAELKRREGKDIFKFIRKMNQPF
ncbi:hypothetical protein RWE39_004376 [Salmonella enterica]|nr:hypothetical protein [Salmonella enterica]